MLSLQKYLIVAGVVVTTTLALVPAQSALAEVNPRLNAFAQAGNSSAYRYWYAGGALRYQLSRHVGTFANYQYDAIGFASGICSGSPASCAASYGRHVGLIGLDWTPNPIRLE